MIPDSGIPHCCVAVNVDTANGNIVGSAYLVRSPNVKSKFERYQSNVFRGKNYHSPSDEERIFTTLDHPREIIYRSIRI
jgi:hypothetical protein